MDKKTSDKLLKKISKLQEQIALFRNKLNEAKKENRLLQRDLKQLQELIEKLPGWFVLLQDEKVILTNRKILHDLGFEQNEVIGRPFLDFVHSDYIKQVKKRYKQHIKGEPVPDAYDLVLVNKEGEKIGCETRMEKIRYRGRRAFAVTMTPLDTRRQDERERLEAEKGRLIAQFSCGMTQQLNTCLDIINKGLTQETTSRENDPFLSELIKVKLWHERLVSLLQHLHGQEALDNGIVVDLAHVVEEARKTAESWAKTGTHKKGSHIQIKTFLRSSPPIRGNPDQIKDAIAFIITNAIEAIPMDGSVFVTAEESGGLAYLFIQDNGTGISPENMERILDPFFTTKNDNHLGVGFTIADAIIKRHGGRIEVMSTLGQGTTVSVQLPIAKSQSPSKTPPPGKVLKGAHVMIVAEEDGIRDLLSQVFITKGAKVTRPIAISKALRQIQKGKVDLVVVDLEGMSSHGIKWIEEITHIDPGLPVACIPSQRGNLEDEKGVLELSNNLILVKRPIETNSLLQVVSEKIANYRFKKTP
ncbi:MAG: hypothetical protein DRG63_06870 [Deltaproteobacteria bacterium]|nr:MAG: hypothetical protein DRG63_06870 [Deltaproteobacteria bacterium]